jgi:hypothetical protein
MGLGNRCFAFGMALPGPPTTVLYLAVRVLWLVQFFRAPAAAARYCRGSARDAMPRAWRHRSTACQLPVSDERRQASMKRRPRRPSAAVGMVVASGSG